MSLADVCLQFYSIFSVELSLFLLIESWFHHLFSRESTDQMQDNVILKLPFSGMWCCVTGQLVPMFHTIVVPFFLDCLTLNMEGTAILWKTRNYSPNDTVTAQKELNTALRTSDIQHYIALNEKGCLFSPWDWNLARCCTHHSRFYWQVFGASTKHTLHQLRPYLLLLIIARYTPWHTICNQTISWPHSFSLCT
jgi:hypothetical protein